MKKLILASLIATALTACGGGSDSSEPKPTPEPAPIWFGLECQDVELGQHMECELSMDAGYSGSYNWMVINPHGNSFMSEDNAPLTFMPEWEGTYTITAGLKEGHTASATFNVVDNTPKVRTVELTYTWKKPLAKQGDWTGQDTEDAFYETHELRPEVYDDYYTISVIDTCGNTSKYTVSLSDINDATIEVCGEAKVTLTPQVTAADAYYQIPMKGSMNIPSDADSAVMNMSWEDYSVILESPYGSNAYDYNLTAIKLSNDTESFDGTPWTYWSDSGRPAHYTIVDANRYDTFDTVYEGPNRDYIISSELEPGKFYQVWVDTVVSEGIPRVTVSDLEYCTYNCDAEMKIEEIAPMTIPSGDPEGPKRHKVVLIENGVAPFSVEAGRRTYNELGFIREDGNTYLAVTGGWETGLFDMKGSITDATGRVLDFTFELTVTR